jgi:hypothetical protein
MQSVATIAADYEARDPAARIALEDSAPEEDASESSCDCRSMRAATSHIRFLREGGGFLQGAAGCEAGQYI